MCKCLQEGSFKNTLSTGHAIAVHYNFVPGSIEVYVECQHKQVIPFTAHQGSEEFRVLYDALWKMKMDVAEDLPE
jgi:hypothetical protein